MEQENGVNGVAISRDGRLALSAGGWVVRVWDLPSGQCLRTLQGHKSIVNTVAITPDGRYAVSGSDDETLRVWDLSDGKCLRTCKGHRGGVIRVIITPDGRRALAGRGWTRIWDLFSGKRLSQWRAEVVLAITPDGRQGFAPGERGTLQVWDLETATVVQTLEGHTDWVGPVAVTPDGGWAVSTSDDDTMRVWHLPSGTCLYVVEERHGAIAIMPDGRYLLSSGGGTIRQWTLDWDYEFPAAADWDEGARPYLASFLMLHTARPQRRSEHPRPEWSEEDFRQLLTELGYRGYGWLRSEGVLRELEKMANLEG